MIMLLLLLLLFKVGQLLIINYIILNTFGLIHHGMRLFDFAHHFSPIFNSNNILLQVAILNKKNNNDIISNKRANTSIKFNNLIKQNISNNYSNERISYINIINNSINYKNNNITIILIIYNITSRNMIFFLLYLKKKYKICLSKYH